MGFSTPNTFILFYYVYQSHSPDHLSTHHFTLTHHQTMTRPLTLHTCSRHAQERRQTWFFLFKASSLMQEWRKMLQRLDSAKYPKSTNAKQCCIGLHSEIRTNRMIVCVPVNASGFPVCHKASSRALVFQLKIRLPWYFSKFMKTVIVRAVKTHCPQSAKGLVGFGPFILYPWYIPAALCVLDLV